MTGTSIEIRVNGQNREVPEAASIADLIELWDFLPNVVAVELNFELIPRERHESTTVVSGDQLEIVSLVGGG